MSNSGSLDFSLTKPKLIPKRNQCNTTIFLFSQQSQKQANN